MSQLQGFLSDKFLGKFGSIHIEAHWGIAGDFFYDLHMHEVVQKNQSKVA